MDPLDGIAVGIVLKLIVHSVRARSLVGLFKTRFESRREAPTRDVEAHGPATLPSLLRALGSRAARRLVGA